jgi:CRISPR-associated endonuclease Csn1
VPIASLKPGDLTDPTRIPDETLRNELYRATRGLTGKEFNKALDDFAKQGSEITDKNGRRLFKGLRRVRVREPLNVIPIRDRSGRPYKAYKGDANACFDIWRLPDGKWTPDIITMFDAHQPKQQDRRPHPAAKKILSLRQNDLIAVERDGRAIELLRIVGFNLQGRLTLAPPNESGALKARDAESNEVDPFKYIYLSTGSLKKLKARQVRVDPLGRVFDPGPRE